jgi:hypothetical protein
MIDGPYYATGKIVRKKPVEVKREAGMTTFEIGFPVCTMHPACDNQTETVAALMNLGERAQWQELPQPAAWPGRTDAIILPAFSGQLVVVGRWLSFEGGGRRWRQDLAAYSATTKSFHGTEVGKITDVTHVQLLSPPPEETPVSLPVDAAPSEGR